MAPIGGNFGQLLDYIIAAPPNLIPYYPSLDDMLYQQHNTIMQCKCFPMAISATTPLAEMLSPEAILLSHRA